MQSWEARVGRYRGRLDQVGTLRCPFLFDEMQPRAVLFPHLFCRNNFTTQVCEANKLMLDCLQPFFLRPPARFGGSLVICNLRSRVKPVPEATVFSAADTGSPARTPRTVG